MSQRIREVKNRNVGVTILYVIIVQNINVHL
jgi:hypothetical protein